MHSRCNSDSDYNVVSVSAGSNNKPDKCSRISRGNEVRKRNTELVYIISDVKISDGNNNNVYGKKRGDLLHNGVYSILYVYNCKVQNISEIIAMRKQIYRDKKQNKRKGKEALIQLYK